MADRKTFMRAEHGGIRRALRYHRADCEWCPYYYFGRCIDAGLPLGAFDDSTSQYRVTSFRHRGDYGLQPPHDWTGDIAPTVDEPLATVQP